MKSGKESISVKIATLILSPTYGASEVFLRNQQNVHHDHQGPAIKKRRVGLATLPRKNLNSRILQGTSLVTLMLILIQTVQRLPSPSMEPSPSMKATSLRIDADGILT
jgi:hypothetical protein